MKTRRFVIVLGFVTLLAAAPAMVAASPQPGGGGCAPGGGWSQWLVSDLLDFFGITEVPPSMDGNGDGITCVRFQELANGRKGWTAVIYADNNVR